MADPRPTGEHIVHSFDDELKALTVTLMQMGGMAETQLASAIDAVAKRDGRLAEKVIEADQQVDDLDQQVDTLVTRLFALRQPMAVDLRVVLTGLRMSGDIERIGDYAKNVAKRAIVLSQHPPLPTVYGVVRMATLVRQRFKEVLDAYAERDVDKAVSVWQRDAEVDELYNSLFREVLTYMMEDPRTITVGTHLLFIAKNLERIGDLATNIAEYIHFMVEGARIEHERPKGDETSLVKAPDEDIATANGGNDEP